MSPLRIAAVIAAVAACAVVWRAGAAAAGNEAPWWTAPPVIAGAAVEGGTLTLSAGTWHGENIVFTYTWERCGPAGSGCTPIMGATDESDGLTDSYALTQLDVGSTIEAVVTATNQTGAATVSSAPTAAVTPVGAQVAQGSLESFGVWSPAVGRTQPVYVYLPPGYDPDRRPGYPVLYLLHGNPGGPGSFVGGVPAGPTEAALVAEGLMRPTLLVMPLGGPNTTVETSWVNGIGPDAAWATFLARDVVGWVDGHFDAQRAAAGRGVAGLSDGGFGALNVALHYPHEFGVVESWAGYERADPTETAVYGDDAALLAYDSPAVVLPREASTLRRAGVYFWLAVGWQDGERFDNAQFASELAAARLPSATLVLPGSHTPSFYRAILPSAFEAASRHFDRTAVPDPAASPPAFTLRFDVAQQGAPDRPALPGISTMDVRGSGTAVFGRGLGGDDGAVAAALRTTGTLEASVGPTALKLAVDAPAVAVRTAGAQPATLLSLPVTVTASNDAACPGGAGGYVDLERSRDATGTTGTVVLDLERHCSISAAFDDAPWRGLTGSAIALRLAVDPVHR